MLPDWVSNPGPLTYKSGALPIALCGPANILFKGTIALLVVKVSKHVISRGLDKSEYLVIIRDNFC